MKVNILLTCDPAITVFGIYPMDLKICVHTRTTQKFIAVLFIIATTWKQPRCPLVSECINKLIHPDDGILFSTKKS